MTKCFICGSDIAEEWRDYMDYILMESYEKCGNCGQVHHFETGATQVTINKQQFVWSYHETEENKREYESYLNAIKTEKARYQICLRD